MNTLKKVSEYLDMVGYDVCSCLLQQRVCSKELQDYLFGP